MTADDIRIIRYMNADTRRFSFWMIFQDNRPHVNSRRFRNKELIKFFESRIGPLGEKWQFDARDAGTFAIKADSDLDVTMMLLKFYK